MKKPIIFLLLINSCFFIFSQGYNHTWLLGTDPGFTLGRIDFSSTNYNLYSEQRLMSFKGTQGNISDQNGNFLMSSNGVWIANKDNNLMLNGNNLNPNSFTSDWPLGLPLSNGNLILPWPNDTTKYILFHQTGNYDPNYMYASRELYYSIIDMTGDSGKGEVIQKNTIIMQDTLGWGLGACKHANGRDWWIVALRDSGDVIHKILLTPFGIQSISSQSFPFPKYQGLATQPVFSPDGLKFAYTHGRGFNGPWVHDIRLLNFDRCSGNFYNPLFINITQDSTEVGVGVAFSPNSKYLYISKFHKIFQFNTDTSDITSSIKTVAINDGFYSPNPPFQTDFWLMYLAANGKIYLTSGSSVQHLHYINNPDLEDTLCNVVQHGLDLNSIWHISAVPNHPNYYLGCDTTCTPCLVSVNEINHDFKFSIYPNPSSGNFNIIYLLPQHKDGKLEIIDITGKIVYEMRLPQWSTLQQFKLNHLSDGIYAVKIISDNFNTVKKLIIAK